MLLGLALGCGKQEAPASAPAGTDPSSAGKKPSSTAAAPSAAAQPGVERGTVYERLFVKGTTLQVASAIRKGASVGKAAADPTEMKRDVACQIVDVKHTPTRAVAKVTCPAAELGPDYPALAFVPADYWVAEPAGLWGLSAEHYKSIDDAVAAQLSPEMMLIANPPRETKMGTDYGANIAVSKGSADAWCVQISEVTDGYDSQSKLCLSQGAGLQSYEQVVVDGADAQAKVGGITSQLKTLAPAAQAGGSATP